MIATSLAVCVLLSSTARSEVTSYAAHGRFVGGEGKPERWFREHWTKTGTYSLEIGDDEGTMARVVIDSCSACVLTDERPHRAYPCNAKQVIRSSPVRRLLPKLETGGGKWGMELDGVVYDAQVVRIALDQYRISDAIADTDGDHPKKGWSGEVRLNPVDFVQLDRSSNDLAQEEPQGRSPRLLDLADGFLADPDVVRCVGRATVGFAISSVTEDGVMTVSDVFECSDAWKQKLRPGTQLQVVGLAVEQVQRVVSDGGRNRWLKDIVCGDAGTVLRLAVVKSPKAARIGVVRDFNQSSASDFGWIRPEDR